MTVGDDRHLDERVRRTARTVLEDSWMPALGYCAPNRAVYPWLWLWDSCFHALIWGALGDDRGAVEVASALSTQDPDGLVPHVGYRLDPAAARELWGRSGRSFLTQPPMYGHALRLLGAWGFAVEHLVDPARSGLEFLLRHRRDPDSGLVRIVHPWETGADDSPRWDHWAGTPFDRSTWGTVKRRLLTTVGRSGCGSGVTNPAFVVAPAGLNALVAFNLRELSAVVGDPALEVEADRIVAALDRRWDPERAAWVDRTEPAVGSARVRTLDALLPVLVTAHEDRVDRVLADLFDGAAYGAPCGPAGVHRGEPAFDPDAYWRGPAWPPLTYLFFVAALRRGRRDVARRLAAVATRSAVTSGFAEYHNPLTGAGRGAAPQGWAGLPVVMRRLLDGTGS